MSTNEPPVGPDQPETPPTGPPSYGSTPPPPPGDAGGYGNYPPPPPSDPGYNAPFSAPDAIGYGWRKFTGNVGNWIIAGLVAFAVIVLFILLSWAVGPKVDYAEVFSGEATTVEVSGGSRILSLIVSIAATIAGMILTGVVMRGGLDETEGRRFSFGDAFSRLPIGPVVIVSAIIAVITSLLNLVPIIGGLVALIVQFFTWFALAFVVDKSQDAVTALQSSFSLVSANFGQSFVLALLSTLVLIAGACLCGIGLIAAYPIVAIATAYAFRKFNNEPVAA